MQINELTGMTDPAPEDTLPIWDVSSGDTRKVPVSALLVAVGSDAALRAQAWAESPTPPDPAVPTSKSAKTWAGQSEASATSSASSAAAAAASMSGTLKPYATRAAMLVDSTPLQLLPAGAIVAAAGLLYRRETGSVAIADFPGFVPNGDATPQHWGAVVNGVTDDLAKYQAAQTGAATNQTTLITGPSVLSGAITESGKYLLRESTGPIAWPTALDAARAFVGTASGNASATSKKVFNAADDTSTGNVHMIFASYRLKPSASPAAYQKNGLFVIAITDDPSSGTGNGGVGTTISRDAVGIDGRGYIAATNATGRAWGMNAYALVEPGGEGQATGMEINVDHTASTPTAFDAPFQKTGLMIVPKQNALTAGVVIRGGGSQGCLKGFVVLTDGLNASATSAYELQDKWRVNKAGDMFFAKATGAETEAGIALMQAGGLAVFTQSAAIGATKFIRGDTLVGAASLWNQDTLGYSTTGVQRVFSRLQTTATVATNAAENGEIRISSMLAGTLTEQMRIGSTGGVAIGATAIGPGGVGRLNLSDHYQVAGLRVVGSRKTGWTPPTGVATRTGFATSTVTLSVLAEHVKALIDDLHANGSGHGLITT